MYVEFKCNLLIFVEMILMTRDDISVIIIWSDLVHYRSLVEQVNIHISSFFGYADCPEEKT